MKPTPSCLLAAAVAVAVVAAFAAGMSDVARAATPLPAWEGEPNTTRQGYAFTSASLTPAAEILRNPFQTPAATVTPGTFSDGWKNPQIPWANSGVLRDGAWDIGKAGTIAVTCKVAATLPATGYRIDFVVYAVAYKGITAMPSFECPGLTASNLTLTQATVATDPKFPGAGWEGLKWTGYFDNVTTNTMSFVIKSPSDNMSVIDTYEVFTKVTGAGVSSYEVWALEQGLVAGPAGRLDNPDHDDRPNLIEYAFGTNPRASNRRRTPNTPKNSSQKDFASASSRCSSAHSREKRMAFWRISFQLIGMQESYGIATVRNNGHADNGEDSAIDGEWQGGSAVDGRPEAPAHGFGVEAFFPPSS